MRRKHLILLVAGIFLQTLLGLRAGEFKMMSGDVEKGEIASVNDEGLVVRREIGGFSPRIGWGKLTQDTLKDMTNNPAAFKFAEPFIEITIEQKERIKKEKQVIKVKDAPTVERPVGSKKFLRSLMTPPGYLILALLFLANLYAAYEVAVFRNRPAVMVCLFSVPFPVVGPLLFLAIPDGEPVPDEFAPEPTVAEANAQVGAPDPVKSTAAGGLGLAAGHDKSPKADAANNQVYKRANTNFDRRFFETKFAGFFRVIASEADKDLVLVVKAAKAEYIAKRISRISSNEMHMQLLRGGAETSVSFSEILEVQARHKDAKA